MVAAWGWVLAVAGGEMQEQGRGGGGGARDPPGTGTGVVGGRGGVVTRWWPAVAVGHGLLRGRWWAHGRELDS